MKYQKELAAIQEYIASFDPEEFTSSVDYDHILAPTPKQLADVQKLKAKLKRNRQIAESFDSLLNNDLIGCEEIITQDEVDALLDGWVASNN